MQCFVQTLERKRPLRRAKHRLEGNNKIIFKETRWEIVDWNYLDQAGTSSGLL
jgi:hypothetical protein